MNRKICYIFVIAFLYAIKTYSQDPNFSQFFASPLTLNPAFTGKFNGDYRLAGNYRNQWPTINNAFITTTGSIDFNLLQDKVPFSDRFGMGFMIFNDKAGNKALISNYYAVSVAYHKGIDEDGYHQIGLGFQSTFMTKRLNTALLTFQDQLTTDGFTGITNESFTSQSVKLNYLDLNTGLLYTGTTNERNSFYLGASLYHANRPKESFKNGNFLLNSRVTIHGGAKIPIGEFNSVYVSANHSTQAKARNTMLGAAYGLSLSDSYENQSNIFIGSWVRLQDALIPYVGLEFGNWQLGISYDINTSPLKAASNLKGGVEISLIYRKSKPDKSLKRIDCPRF